MEQSLSAGDAGGRDEDVNITYCGFDPLAEPSYPVNVADVGSKREKFALASLQLMSCDVQLLLVQVGQHHGDALFQQQPGGLRADAPAAAGDQRGLALDAEIHEGSFEIQTLIDEERKVEPEPAGGC